MLQETMMSASSSCDFFLRINPCWRVCAFDAIGHFGGTLMAWNPLVVGMKYFSCCAGIIVEGKLKGFSSMFVF